MEGYKKVLHGLLEFTFDPPPRSRHDSSSNRPSSMVWPLEENQGPSQLHGHGLWLVWAVALTMDLQVPLHHKCKLLNSGQHFLESTYFSFSWIKIAKHLVASGRLLEVDNRVVVHEVHLAWVFVSSSRHEGSKCQRACQSVIKYWALFCCLHCTFQRQYLESWAPSKKLGISRNRLCDAPRFLEDASYDKGNDGWLTTLLPPLKLFLPICKNATLNMIFSFTEIF